MLCLNGKEIHECLTYTEVMDGVEKAFAIYQKGDFTMPDRLSVSCGGNSILLLMPCVAEGSFSTKLVTVFPENRAKGRPIINGIVVLNDLETGEVLAIMDGKTVTAMRTGAVTGTSIRYIAKEDAESVGLVGCGTQGFYQLMCACAARDIKRIYLYDIAEEQIAVMSAKLAEAAPEVTVQAVTSAEELVIPSDIIITATTARSPVFPDDPELFKGKHFVAIGSFEPDVREYPDAIFKMINKVWVDVDFASEESGELSTPLDTGLLKKEQIETLGQLIQSGSKPERGEFGTTFFKTVGMALFDLVTARLVYGKATSLKLGTEVSL